MIYAASDIHGEYELFCALLEKSYRRDKSRSARSIRDYYKIHLDTGAWSGGVMGCFCVDTLKAYYVF